MHWYTKIPVIVIVGLVVSALCAVMVDPTSIVDRIESLLAGMLPGASSNKFYMVLTDALLGAAFAAPGVIVATALVLRVHEQAPPDGKTRCGNCGHALRGLREPRCPECGKRI
jgi:hypothetical protein